MKQFAQAQRRLREQGIQSLLHPDRHGLPSKSEMLGKPCSCDGDAENEGAETGQS